VSVVFCVSERTEDRLNTLGRGNVLENGNKNKKERYRDSIQTLSSVLLLDHAYFGNSSDLLIVACSLRWRSAGRGDASFPSLRSGRRELDRERRGNIPRPRALRRKAGVPDWQAMPYARFRTLIVGAMQRDIME